MPKARYAPTLYLLLAVVVFTGILSPARTALADRYGDGQVTAMEAKAYLDDTMTIAARVAFGRHQYAGLNGVAGAVPARAGDGGVFPVRPGLDDSGAPEIGEKFRDCEECPEMVVVPAGSFDMGSPSHEEGRYDDEGPVHRVRISEPFAVGVYEVTRGEWGRFVSRTGYSSGGSCWTYESDEWKNRSGRGWRSPGFSQSDSHPVVCVNFGDAQAYVGWLSRETGRGYRLLSESEWEYVARGGTTGPFHFGGAITSGEANYSGNYGGTVLVGSFPANSFGLHDVHGNVWEWVEDCWHGSYHGAPVDGSAWTRGGDCGSRVLRGGSWNYIPWSLRSAYRERSATGHRLSVVGFRVARTLD